MQKVIIIGAGGHGKVVADAILKMGGFLIAGFTDDNKSKGTKVFMDYEVLGANSEADFDSSITLFVVAIGNNDIRTKLYQQHSQKKTPLTVIHPGTHIGYEVTIGSGTVVLAGAVINSCVTIGENCIINSLALVDHDSSVGAHTHVSQAAFVGSGNHIQGNSWIKPNEVVPSAFYKL